MTTGKPTEWQLHLFQIQLAWNEFSREVRQHASICWPCCASRPPTNTLRHRINLMNRESIRTWHLEKRHSCTYARVAPLKSKGTRRVKSGNDACDNQFKAWDGQSISLSCSAGIRAIRAAASTAAMVISGCSKQFWPMRLELSAPGNYRDWCEIIKIGISSFGSAGFEASC